MTTEIVGRFRGDGLRVGIVVARFNDFITSRLLAAAVDTLERHGVAGSDITVVWVPGAWEIPPVAQRLAQPARGLDAVVCLGAVIRGGTPHFDHVCARVARGVAQVGDSAELPVIFGVLTCDSIEQAIERAGTKAGNKGADAAMAALEMADLYRNLAGGQ
jgi:6,7-dimethyl-8-ribityllumazine synthase